MFEKIFFNKSNSKICNFCRKKDYKSITINHITICENCLNFMLDIMEDLEKEEKRMNLKTK